MLHTWKAQMHVKYFLANKLSQRLSVICIYIAFLFDNNDKFTFNKPHISSACFCSATSNRWSIGAILSSHLSPHLGHQNMTFSERPHCIHFDKYIESVESA